MVSQPTVDLTAIAANVSRIRSLSESNPYAVVLSKWSLFVSVISVAATVAVGFVAVAISRRLSSRTDELLTDRLRSFQPYDDRRRQLDPNAWELLVAAFAMSNEGEEDVAEESLARKLGPHRAFLKPLVDQLTRSDWLVRGETSGSFNINPDAVAYLKFWVPPSGE
jgi:hypothetical protein